MARTKINHEDIRSLEYLDFITTGTATPNTEGRVSWNADDGTIQIGLPGGEVVNQVGQEILLPRQVINDVGADCYNGQLVYINGGDNNNLTFKLAKADAEVTSASTLAMLTENIPNSGNKKGFATMLGIVRGSASQPIDTSADAPGTVLYLSPTTAGSFTSTKPAAPNHAVTIGTVFRQHATEGAVLVHITNGFELGELHDVDTTESKTTPVDADAVLLQDSADNSIWKKLTWANLKAGVSAAGIFVPYTVLDDTQDPTGWVDPASVNLSYSTTNRTITLTGTLDYYWRGVKYSLTAPWTSDPHDAADNRYFLVSRDGTTFEWSTDPWEFYELMVAIARKYSTSPAYQFAVREPHGLMPWQVHRELHETISAYRVSGGGLIVGTYAENTATDAATTPSFAAMVMADEDIETTIAEWTQGTYTTLYVGASNYPSFNVGNSFPFLNALNGYIYVNNPTTGALTQATNNQYVNVYIMRIPVTDDAESQSYRLVCLQPQRAYTSLAAAQAEDTRSLSFGNLVPSVPEIVFYERITYVLASGDTNTGKCRIATNGISYIFGSRMSQISAGGAAGVPTAENVPFTPTGNISAINVQAAIEELDSEKIGGTGTIGRVAEFATDTKTIQAAKLIAPTGAVLTLVNADAKSVTFPGAANDTVAMLAQANVFSATQSATKLQLYNTGHGSATNVLLGGLYGKYVSTDNAAAAAAIEIYTNGTTWYKGDIVFKTNNVDGTDPANPPVERVRITAEGNLQFGTDTAGGNFLQRAQAGWLDVIRVYRAGVEKWALQDSSGAARFTERLEIIAASDNVNLYTKAHSSQTTDVYQARNSSDSVMMAIAKNGAIKPASLADSAAENNTIYYSTTASKLVYKDSGGTVNNLY